jgi:tripartite-type tricarboxylate transporter receptor subunit TctC
MLQRILAVLVAVVAIGRALTAAEAYPTKPVVIVVPFPAGAGPDVLARMLGERLSARLGQPVVVENRPGASGYVGAAAVARAAPDGHTLLMTPNTLFIAPHLAPKATTVQVHVVNDFAPVIMPSQTAMVMVANPSLGVKNAKEFAALVKKQPGMAFASSGNGSVLHIAGELFKRSAGLDMLHVPYRGIAPAIADVIGGHVKVTYAGLGPIASYLNAGTLIPLATVEERRSSALPDVPTAIEQGFPGVAVEGWYALLAPKETPAAVVQRLNSEINAILAAPEVRERIKSSGEIVLGGTSAALAKRMQGDYERYGAIVKELNISAD